MPERIPSTPPVILPLPPGTQPLWSVMIPAYNCIGYLKETIESVLSQALPANQMQVEVVDDASTDGDVKALVQQYGGRVAYFRQESNVGSLRNFETCLKRARGEYIHLLHGDDRVKKGYYEKMEHLFQRYPSAGAAFCRFGYINEAGEKLYTQPKEMESDGILDNWLFRIAERNRIQFAAITVKRYVYEILGSFYALTYCEDWEMWVRIAKHYAVCYTPEVLADYRKHQNSITGQKFLSSGFLDDLSTAMEMIREHLPENRRLQVLQQAKHFYSLYGMQVAHQVWQSMRDKAPAKNILKKSLRIQKSFPGYKEALKLYLKFLFH